ncbi:MAG TPA: hypothetical protein VF820_04925 [Patescibacteria group bacterium]
MPNQKNHVENSVLGHTHIATGYTFTAPSGNVFKGKKQTIAISASLQQDLLKTLLITFFLIAAELILFYLLKQRVLILPLVQY